MKTSKGLKEKRLALALMEVSDLLSVRSLNTTYGDDVRLHPLTALVSSCVLHDGWGLGSSRISLCS